MGISGVSLGSHAQDRLMCHFTAILFAALQCCCTRPPVNLCCFSYVLRANPIPADLYIHNQAFLAIS